MNMKEALAIPTLANVAVAGAISGVLSELVGAATAPWEDVGLKKASEIFRTDLRKQYITCSTNSFARGVASLMRTAPAFIFPAAISGGLGFVAYEFAKEWPTKQGS